MSQSPVNIFRCRSSHSSDRACPDYSLADYFVFVHTKASTRSTTGALPFASVMRAIDMSSSPPEVYGHVRALEPQLLAPAVACDAHLHHFNRGGRLREVAAAPSAAPTKGTRFVFRTKGVEACYGGAYAARYRRHCLGTYQTRLSAALAVDRACARDEESTYTGCTANVQQACRLMTNEWADGRDWKERITVGELRVVLDGLAWFQARDEVGGKVNPEVVAALAAVEAGECPRRSHA